MRTQTQDKILCPTVQEALDGMLHHIQNVLQNRQDIDALHDTPYPEFAEYIMEAEERIHGTRPILLSSERDPEVWARKHVGHQDDLVCKLSTSNYSKEESPSELHLGQNIYWCLKTAIKRNMGNASIRDIFLNVHQLDSQLEERNQILAGGLQLYRDLMREMWAVYRVDLFNRNETITSIQLLATEINAAVNRSTHSGLIGGSEPKNCLVVRRTPDFHTLKGCMPDHQVAFSSGRFCDQLVLFLHFHKAGGSSIIEHFIDRGLWYDLDTNADIDKYGT